MMINKLKVLSIIFFYMVVVLWTEIQGMDGKKENNQQVESPKLTNVDKLPVPLTLEHSGKSGESTLQSVPSTPNIKKKNNRVPATDPSHRKKTASRILKKKDDKQEKLKLSEALPEHIKDLFVNFKDESYKAEIIDLYQNPPKKLFFKRGQDRNQGAMGNVIKCLDKENNSVEEFGMTSTEINALSCNLFPILKKYTNLKIIDISGNSISKKTAKSLIDQNCFDGIGSLIYLSMNTNNIKESSKNIIEYFNNRGNLYYLGLSNNYIKQDTLDSIEGKENISIRILDLSKNNLSKEWSLKFPCIYLNEITNMVENDKNLLLGDLSISLEKLKVIEGEKGKDGEKVLPYYPRSPISSSTLSDRWKSSERIMAVDPSGVGKDFTGYAVIAVNAQQEYLIIEAQGIKGDGLSDETLDNLSEVVERHKVSKIAIEDNFNKGAYSRLLEKHYQLRRIQMYSRSFHVVTDHNFKIEDYTTKEKEKSIRIIGTLESLLNSEQLFIEKNFFDKDYNSRDTQESLLHEMSWLKEEGQSTTKHDDIVDALAMAISYHKKQGESEKSENKSIAYQKELDALKKTAHKLYCNDTGYIEVTEQICVDDKEQSYLIIKFDGSKGDCCFNVLGLERDQLIKKMNEYVLFCENTLSEKEMESKITDLRELKEILDRMLTTAKQNDISALKGHDFSGWNNKINQIIHEYKKNELDKMFDEIIKQQKLGSDYIDWKIILDITNDIKKIIYNPSDSEKHVIPYKEFVGKFVADLWKKVGDSELTSKINSNLIKVEVLDNQGNILRDVRDDDLSSLQEELSEKSKKYIKYRIEFPRASAVRKNEIINEFYIKNHEWLDPSAIMDLGVYFNFKAKLFKKDERSLIIRLDAKTPDENECEDNSIKYRLMLYVNDNHYDLLFPLQGLTTKISQL